MAEQMKSMLWIEVAATAVRGTEGIKGYVIWWVVYLEAVLRARAGEGRVVTQKCDGDRVAILPRPPPSFHPPTRLSSRLVPKYILVIPGRNGELEQVCAAHSDCIFRS